MVDGSVVRCVVVTKTWLAESKQMTQMTQRRWDEMKAEESNHCSRKSERKSQSEVEGSVEGSENRDKGTGSSVASTVLQKNKSSK